MKAPEVNHSDGEDHSQQDPLDSWILLCSKCNKSISASRPPVHIAENCSCAELSTVTEGLAQTSIKDKSHYSGGDSFQHGPPDTPKYQRPPTYASSYNSVEGPEGPEKTDPNIAIRRPSPNNWIALVPERGLNEKQHHCTSSFNDKMPETLQRFLLHEEDYHFFFGKMPGNQEHTFLRQETFVTSSCSMKAKKSTRASEQSSTTTSGTSSRSFVGWGVDPVAGAGEWAGDGHDYPLWMSESAFEGC